MTDFHWPTKLADFINCMSSSVGKTLRVSVVGSIQVRWTYRHVANSIKTMKV